MFQFQDGSIKWWSPVYIVDTKDMFQFQDGSIKCEYGPVSKLMNIEFQFQDGSIKWLFVVGGAGAGKSFQFQDGSIKWNGKVRLHLRLWRFNSKMVRLNVAYLFAFRKRGTVSIPRWFD